MNVSAAAKTQDRVATDQVIDAGSSSGRAGLIWGVTRILLGWTFLWPFFDKFFGLGFATCRAEDSSAIKFGCDGAFVKGGSPTFGFLKFGTASSHTGGLFDWLASSGPTSQNIVDYVFMAALLLIGVGLLLGIAMRLSTIGGALLLVFMYLAGSVWPVNNPFIDEHIIFAVVLIGLMFANAGDYLGLGRRWKQADTVQRMPFLR